MMSYKGLRKSYCVVCGSVATYCGKPGWACDEHRDSEEPIRYDSTTGQPLPD